jgi:hypothetical protein
MTYCPEVHADPTNGLRGKPFAASSRLVEMPADWQSRPIAYDTWAARADLAVTLDQHLYPALLPSIQGHAKKQNIAIAVHEGTCGISAGMLIRKQVDIAGFCCPPGEMARLPGLRFHTLGVAGLAILVNAANPIDSITTEQARTIFQGKIYNWSELKTAAGIRLPDMPIRTIGRLHCKTRPGHWRLLLDNEDLFSPRLREVGTIQDMILHVASDRGAIGFEVLWNIDRYKQKGKVKALKIDGYSPDNPEHIVSGKYPFYRTYNITTWEGAGVRNPLASVLTEYLLKTVNSLDRIHGIIPASALRQAGWKFKGDELTGQPL